MNKMLRYIAVFLFFVGCSQKQEQKNIATFIPKVVSAKEHIVSKDSMAKPTIILIDESTFPKIPAEETIILPTNSNVKIVGAPRIVIAGVPLSIDLGSNSFKIPKALTVINNSFVAGTPEIIIAKDPYVKELNPQSFSSFSKLQGLKHGTIRSMLQDNNGNIWFGTNGGGVSKYDGKSFTNFTEKEGLVNNTIWSILQDKLGNIWFGTDSGASKYDGNNFTNFTEKEGLISNRIWTIIEDKKGNIWFGTNNGVSKYDGNIVEEIEKGIKRPKEDLKDLKKIKNKFVKSITNFTENEGLGNNRIFSILQDKNENIWFGSSGVVSKFNGKSFLNYTENEGLANNSILSMLQDKNGNIWFGTDGSGVLKYDGNYFTYFTENEGLSNNIVLSILQDNIGNIWFGTLGGGVSKYDGNRVEAILRGENIPKQERHGFQTIDNNIVKCFTHFTEKEGLCNNIVYSILQDKSGNLWFGTYDNGVSKYDGKLFTHFTENEGLSNNRVLSILQGFSGNIWFGTDAGVNKYDGISFTHFTDEVLKENSIYSILRDNKGNLWFGTYGGGVLKYDGITYTKFTEKEGLSNNIVYCILQDKKGNLWFGTNGGGVSKYDGKTFTHFTEKEGLSNNIVYCMLQDKKENLWFGTYGGGVTKYDGKTFTHFTEKEGLSNNVVLSILQDNNENLWFGTYGAGVTKYNGKTFTHFTEREGLSNNNVYSILQDRAGNLWFGTRFGLSKLSIEKLKLKVENANKPLFKNYTFEDGFLGIGCNLGAIYEDRAGTIWIGANDRLTAFHPEGDNDNVTPPNIQLTGIQLFNENIPWVTLCAKKHKKLILSNGVNIDNVKFENLTQWYNLPQNLILPYNINFITFNFIGITQKQNRKIKYQYKLEGLENNWSTITNRIEASYGNLSHGNYIFKVKARNSEGYWSKEFNYPFTISPVWWKTWLAKITLIVLIILLIIGYIKLREYRIKRDKKLLEIKVKEQTYELHEKNEVLSTKNEEITAQRNEIEAQRDLVTQQKEHIEEIHKEVTDSINYAERIQHSFLATRELLDENLNEYFILFQPKAVVSGDFYWAYKLNNGKFLLATADSTGHGVPGAIMSILNIYSLENAIEKGLNEPFEILNETRKNIISRLKKDGSNEGGKDGMDASLICFDFANMKFTYSAAYSPIWVIRNNKLLLLSPDNMPIGKHENDQISFSQHEFLLQKGDIIYTLTDGFSDQFGGPKGKKYRNRQLRELLNSTSHLPMHEQKQQLNSAFDNWRGNLEQVDDVTIIGIKV